VVAEQPDVPHLVERREYMRIEHFGPVGPVEAFDVRVLVRLAGYNRS